MLFKRSVPGFLNHVYETKGGILVPMFDAFVPKHQNVLAVLRRPDGKLLIPASNIVTDAGDIFYAQMGAGESPTNAFGVLILATAGTPGKSATDDDFTQIAASEKAHDGTYPKSNDGDADNTGGGTDVTTYLTSYTKADFNATGITHGLITNATPGATEPILTGYAFAASFNKTADDTLKVFTNHTHTGV
ncbi:MAG: hypothetical protein V3U18_08375 [Alphaproteobacteria bacterium]